MPSTKSFILGGKSADARLVAGLILFGLWSGTSLAQAINSTPSTQPYPTPVNPAESIISEYTTEAPPNPTAPPYTLLRFNEDYHYLANPANRTDPFDPLKYIPLNPDDSYSYLSLGGEIRERYEDFTNPGFGIAPSPGHDEYLLQRITLDADLHLNANVRFFVQGISGLQFGNEATAPPVNQDPVDLQQAFADVRLGDSPESADYLVIRGGRFEMSYGSGRLVATRAAPNIPFKFDGLQLIDKSGESKIYAFVTKPARENKYTFDDEYPGQLFWGIYGTTPVLSHALDLKEDIYYIGYQNNESAYAAGTGDEVRQTFGTRLFGEQNGFDYDVEPMIQTGTFRGQDILAWGFGSSLGYRFEGAVLKPRIGLNFGVASGNTKDGSFGTFDPLYFKAGYFNDANAIRPSNIIDIHPTLQLLPKNNILLTLGSDILWRYTNNDGIYGPPGNLEIPAGGSSQYVATTAEISVQWEINRHLTWITSYNHFFTSDAVRQIGGKDIDYLGTWVTFTW
jgi:hypothetical protein